VSELPMHTRPNILLIMTDQQRRQTVGANPGSWIDTPHIDRLAAEGVSFTDAYAACPICVPTRLTLLTGLHANRLNVNEPALDNGGGIPDASRTLPSLLRRAGYTTAVIGKTHVKPYGCDLGFEHSQLLENSDAVEYSRYLRQHGFNYKDVFHNAAYDGVWAYDARVPAEHFPAEWVTRNSVQYIRRQAGGAKPWFLWTSYFKPHNPYDPPAPYRGMLDASALPPPDAAEAELHEKPRVYDERRAFYLAKRKGVEPTQQDISNSRARYAECCLMLDDKVGRLVAALKESGQWDHTVVIYTSDHGDMLGDHHLWHKTLAYESSAGIPLVMRMPAARGAGQSAALASTIDLAPTCLALAGAEIPPEMPGRNLTDAYAATPADWRDELYIECSYYPSTLTAIRRGSWKYVHFINGGEEELYDLSADPAEVCNLAARDEYAGQKAELRRRLVELIRREGPAWALDGDDLAEVAFRPEYCRYSPARTAQSRLPAPPKASPRRK